MMLFTSIGSIHSVMMLVAAVLSMSVSMQQMSQSNALRTTPQQAAVKLAPLEKADGGFMLGAWYDRPNGDTPAAMNARVNYKPLSFFQTDIDVSLTKPWTAPNYTTQFLQHLMDTNSTADAYLTVYALGGFDTITQDVVTDLTNRIGAIIASGRRVFLRLLPEMNGNWFLYGMFPSKFKETWKSMYTSIKGGLGTDAASNLAFIWSPNSGQGYPWKGGIAYPNITNDTFGNAAQRVAELDTNGNGILDDKDDPYIPFYPGDDYVDWVGMSIYSYGSQWPWHDNVIPASGAFQAFLDGTYLGDTGLFPYYSMFSGPGCSVSKGNKPFIISETAATYHYAWNPNETHNPDFTLDLVTYSRAVIKQAWWQQFLNQTFLAAYPRVQAACFFEFIKAEELTLRDFTSLGAPPNGFPEDADVVAAFKQDAQTLFGTMIAWATSTVPAATTKISAGGGSTATGGSSVTVSTSKPSGASSVLSSSVFLTIFVGAVACAASLFV